MQKIAIRLRKGRNAWRAGHHQTHEFTLQAFCDLTSVTSAYVIAAAHRGTVGHSSSNAFSTLAAADSLWLLGTDYAGKRPGDEKQTVSFTFEMTTMHHGAFWRFIDDRKHADSGRPMPMELEKFRLEVV